MDMSMWGYHDPSEIFDSWFFSDLEDHLMRTPGPPTPENLGFFAAMFANKHRREKIYEQHRISGNAPPLGPLGIDEHKSGKVDPLSHIPKVLDNPPLDKRYEQVRQRVMQRHPHQQPIRENVRQFVLKHYAEAQKIATQLGNGVTAAEVLAIAGNETGWGNSATKAKYGNFFGLHGHGPAGTYNTTGRPSVPTPIFPITADDDGFKASGQVFVKLLIQKGVLTSGIGNNPKAFFDALHKAHLYADTNPHYAADMVATSPRGAYEAVRQCIEQLKQDGKL
jgi:hypothetical protein